MAYRTTPCEVMNMCMIMDNNGNVLVEEKVGIDFHGFIFPGGHVEYGESITNSVIREIKEETGLIITKPKLCGIKTWENPDGAKGLVYLYKADNFSGEIKSSIEGEIRWIPLNKFKEVLETNNLWYMKETLNIFLDDNISELHLSGGENNRILNYE